ncbi:hypothetical protein BDZ91DRAFT_748688 [Kalaharituber pfeilii]|nr:hypothetical protein BDZ91DRAFT_748688 [Kalaharituber pfeilii]
MSRIPRLPLNGTTLKLSSRHTDCYTIDELRAAIKELPYPDIYEAKSTTKGLQSGKELPELKATFLQKFETVFVWFQLRSWTVTTGGISAILQRVVAIDRKKAPTALFQGRDDTPEQARERNGPKRRKMIA